MAEYIHHVNLMPGTPTGYYTITGEKDMTETEKKLVDAERAVDEAKQAVQDIRKAIEAEEWKMGDCFRYRARCRMIVKCQNRYYAIDSCGLEAARGESIDHLMRNDYHNAKRITFQEWAASRTVKEVW